MFMKSNNLVETKMLMLLASLATDHDYDAPSPGRCIGCSSHEESGTGGAGVVTTSMKDFSHQILSSTWKWKCLTWSLSHQGRPMTAS
ncbi:hypothetical protein AALO_G00136310 [Alosa alosa]|uniref:Secreted protein n=1 Tax=Alosa alosa TaxID=278164 RepID=A0AAV6GH85_9TELE|nr:hypothetical protein AALO_G00136310 [Alosa alosa]